MLIHNYIKLTGEYDPYKLQFIDYAINTFLLVLTGLDVQ